MGIKGKEMYCICATLWQTWFLRWYLVIFRRKKPPSFVQSSSPAVVKTVMMIHLELFVNKKTPCSCINSSISRSVRSLSHGGVTGVSVKNCQCCVCFLTSHTCHVFSLVVKGRFTASAYWGYKRAVLFTCKLHDCTLIIPQVGFCLSSWTAGACPLLSEQLTNKEERKGNGPSVL